MHELAPLKHTHNDRLRRAICYQCMARRAGKWIQLPFDCPNGWFSWRTLSLTSVQFERATVGEKRDRREKKKKKKHPERTQFLVTTHQKNRSKENFHLENPIPFAKSHCMVNKIETGGKTKKSRFSRRQKCKWKSENSIWKTICLPFVGQIEREWSTVRLVVVLAFAEVNKIRSDFWVAFLHSDKWDATHKSYTFGDTNTISELWIVAKIRVHFFFFVSRSRRPCAHTSKN